MDFRTGIHEAHTKAVALRDSTASPFNPDTQRQFYYRVQLPPVTRAKDDIIVDIIVDVIVSHFPHNIEELPSRNHLCGVKCCLADINTIPFLKVSAA